MKTVIIHPLLLRELINRVDIRQAKLPVDDVISEDDFSPSSRVFADEFTVRRSRSRQAVPSSRRQLFPVQINTLSGELDSNLDPERSVQISHVF